MSKKVKVTQNFGLDFEILNSEVFNINDHIEVSIPVPGIYIPEILSTTPHNGLMKIRDILNYLGRGLYIEIKDRHVVKLYNTIRLHHHKMTVDGIDMKPEALATMNQALEKMEEKVYKYDRYRKDKQSRKIPVKDIIATKFKFSENKRQQHMHNQMEQLMDSYRKKYGNVANDDDDSITSRFKPKINRMYQNGHIKPVHSYDVVGKLNEGIINKTMEKSRSRLTKTGGMYEDTVMTDGTSYASDTGDESVVEIDDNTVEREYLKNFFGR